MNRTAPVALFLSGLVLSSVAFAQEPNPTSVPAPAGVVVKQGNDVFFYRVKVVQRDIDAVNYFHRSGSTHIAFEGTSLLPGGRGEATVKSERGGITIDAEFKGLTPANGFGPEYLTYVLWAISPDGRANNLGEVLPAGTKNNIHVTTALQSFGLIITAEPYFSVTEPSDVIVMKNVFNDQTQGVLEKVDAHATLMPRGAYQYETDGAHTVSHPITRNERSPLELYEAYNALRIAQVAGAEKYSPSIYGKANQDLQNAAAMDQDKHRDEKLEITMAREAVEQAEDARVDTLRKQAAERQRNAELAKNQAQAQAAESRQQAAAANANAQQSQLQAEQAALAEKEARLRAEQAQMAKANADAQAAQARAHELEANQRAADAIARARELREKLRAQLNAVLQTTETPRGLVVNLTDVLFDTGKYTLKPDTKLSLARVAGILQAHPTLKVQVEGYTDSTGSDELNQKLSENRASTTAAFLVSQGVAQENVTSAGYGKADPVADNSTSAGRAQNRRVNLVVSGEEIGVTTTNGPAGNNQ
jgi:outer membrane protein OmpA-like peptidoglycan-associated protein